MASNYYLNEGMSESLRYESSNPSYSQSEFASALSALSANDYTLADEKHWLLSSDLISITEGLSSERDPSPDLAGQIPGLRTWYNYIGKPSPELLGTNPQIDCIARLLPNGDTQYTSYNYYPTTLAPGFPAGAGFVSSNSSSYSIPNGANGALLTSFNYATNSVDLVSVSNSAGQYVNLGYNSNHQITAMTNALGQQTTLTWDSFTLNLAGVVYPSGQSISASYNYPQNPASGTSSMLQWLTIQPAGRCFTNNSYYAGFPTSVTDDRGVTVRNTWDGLNRLTGTTFPDGSSISNVYSRLDVVGRQDRLGNWTYFTYDALQHLTTNVNANGAVTSYSYCGCGSLDSILDALGNNTYLNYDNQGSLTNVTFPDSSSLNWQYDLARRVAVAFDGGNRYFQFAYNNQGLVTNVTSANGAMESTVYDVLNRPISVTDANGVTVTNQYDGINELLQRTWADTASERYGYSAAGLIAYTNRDGFHTFYTRDAASRLMAVTNANREVIRFSYDSMNNVTSLIDGTSNQTRWQYNQYGWLTNKMDGLGRTDFNYAYNANGWVTNRWTPEKGNTAYSYDGVGNLKAIVYPIQTINYAYDALNQLTNMIDASGTNMFSYTPLGQLQNETGPWPSDAVGYSYSQGLRMNMSLTQPVGSWSENYTYDSGWRLQTLTSMAGSFSYNYNFQPASSLVTAIALPNGASVANGYDALARLRQTALVNYWGHTLDGYSYIPDPLGLRTNIVRSLGLTTNSVMVAY
jgi:YD repeat-containing protein